MPGEEKRQPDEVQPVSMSDGLDAIENAEDIPDALKRILRQLSAAVEDNDRRTAKLEETPFITDIEHDENFGSELIDGKFALWLDEDEVISGPIGTFAAGSGPPPGPPVVVTDVTEGQAGDTIVTKYDGTDGTTTITRPGTPTGGDSGDTLDRWGSCGGGAPDIYLDPVVFDNAPDADPTIQLDGSGFCYQIEAHDVTGNPETAWTDIDYVDSCDATDCEDSSAVPSSCAGLDKTKDYRIASYVNTMFDPSGCAASGGFCSEYSATPWPGTFPDGTAGEGAGACLWYADADCSEDYEVNGHGFHGTETTITLIVSTRWELQVSCDNNDPPACAGGTIIWKGIKTTGATPAGTYTRDSGCSVGPATVTVEEV